MTRNSYIWFCVLCLFLATYVHQKFCFQRVFVLFINVVEILLKETVKNFGYHLIPVSDFLYLRR